MRNVRGGKTEKVERLQKRRLGPDGRGGQRYDSSDSGPPVQGLSMFARGAAGAMDESHEKPGSQSRAARTGTFNVCARSCWRHG